MARSQSTDMYHAMKYHMKVVSTGVDGGQKVGAQGGFNTLTLPEATVEVVEYKEGIYLYKRKFPGDVTFSDITATNGVIKGNTDTYKWLRAAYLGKEYRCDLQIKHFHREESGEGTNYLDVQPKRVINVFEAFASRVKPGSDFDGMSQEISVASLDIEIEEFTELSLGV